MSDKLNAKIDSIISTWNARFADLQKRQAGGQVIGKQHVQSILLDIGKDIYDADLRPATIEALGYRKDEITTILYNVTSQKIAAHEVVPGMEGSQLPVDGIQAAALSAAPADRRAALLAAISTQASYFPEKPGTDIAADVLQTVAAASIPPASAAALQAIPVLPAAVPAIPSPGEGIVAAPAQPAQPEHELTISHYHEQKEAVITPEMLKSTATAIAQKQLGTYMPEKMAGSQDMIRIEHQSPASLSEQLFKIPHGPSTGGLAPGERAIVSNAPVGGLDTQEAVAQMPVQVIKPNTPVSNAAGPL